MGGRCEKQGKKFAKKSCPKGYEYDHTLGKCAITVQTFAEKRCRSKGLKGVKSGRGCQCPRGFEHSKHGKCVMREHKFAQKECAHGYEWSLLWGKCVSYTKKTC